MSMGAGGEAIVGGDEQCGNDLAGVDAREGEGEELEASDAMRAEASGRCPLDT